MFRPIARSHRRPHRRGTSFILIVVVMLSMFAVVGTAYALFAMREARLGLARKDEQGGGATAPLRAPDPTDTVNAFLGTLIYDTGDANTDLANALRGHSIGRSMYGRDLLNPFNTTPWNGVGLFHEDVNNNTGPYAGYGLTGDRAQFVNYRAGAVNGKPFLLDPEYMGLRGFDTMTGQLLPFDPTLHNYVSKAAGVSYPDLKDFFAGAVDPVTGAVLVPSFHRDWLFRDPSRPATESPLHPNNANWYNAPGGLLTLRPRPFDHPQFPRVPPNADGSYSGDVQNWPGGYTYGPDASGKPGFHNRNDSLWMNLGLPIITLPGNRKVQPMVAPLIVPMDGLFNASAHGNNYGPSYTGYGPWEVNMAAALGGEAANVVGARRAPLQQRNTIVNNRAYNPYTTGPLPSYAPVAWSNTAASLAYPQAPNSLTGLPAFTGGFQATNAPVPNHPSLFNPTEWPGDGTGFLRTFPLGDTKRLQRFAFTPDWYGQADVTAAAPNGLQGTYPFNFATGQNTANSYRLDPAHSTRGLVITRGFGLDRPKLTPTFLSGALSLAGANGKPTQAAATPYPSPQLPGTGSDFAAANRWVNALAALGSVNLNRPLADYRSDTTKALSFPGNVTVMSAAQADSDRQALARDIFARLVASLGAAATVNPTTGQVTITAPPGSGQYDALRYLAQLAVNIVDYVDSDDISTAFTWNNTAAGVPEIVYGVEKPRLVINEAYGEITNDPADPVDGPIVGLVQQKPQKPAQVRFWLELLNPTSKLAPAGGPFGPLGTGAVPLSAYQVQIRRDFRKTVAMGGPDVGSQYQAQILNPANTRGTFTNPDVPGSPLGGAPITTVDPNDPAANALAYNPNGVNLPANGFVLVGPQTTAKGDEFAPAGGPWTPANWIPTPLIYSFPLPMSNTTFSDPEFKRHVVLLQRTANPYLPPDPTTNPYITVDMMDYVPAFDAVHRGKNDAGNRNARDMTNMTGYDPVSDPRPALNRFSVGKVQPYAGHAVPTNFGGGAGNYNTYVFTDATNPALSSMVLPQNPPPQNPLPMPGVPKHTFGRHNGVGNGQPGGTTVTAAAPPALSDTIMLPFDWMAHLDRPLVNQIELLTVADSASHFVTQNFLQQQGNSLVYTAGHGRWTDNATGLARALEMLAVKPYTVGVPHGGRVPGQIAINVVRDKRVLAGLLDVPAASATGFDGNFRDNQAWKTWMATRERGGVITRPLADGVTQLPTPADPGQTVSDAGTPVDASNTPYARPFASSGGPIAAPVTAPAIGFAYGGGTEDGLFRGAGPGAPPSLFLTAPSHPYLKAEPVRKIFNNTTTVSHTYMVFLTIGYFDVVNANPSAPAGWPAGVAVPPTLGAEAFLAVPGDMRQKFVAMIDMSNMALTANPTPFFTSLEGTAYAPAGPPSPGPVTLNIAYSSFNGTNLYVAADGQEVEIRAGSKLILGYGTELQVVTVANGGILGAGQIRVTADNGVFRTAWGGTCVSNVQPGYPGPQAGFAYTNPAYRPVLPYIERLR